MGWDGSQQSRGQLLLVGAVILAAVIIGLVIVVNSSLFIENAGGPDATSSVGQVSNIDYNLRQAVRTVTLRVNHASASHTSPGVATRVERNVSTLSQITRITYVSSQSTVVSASYDNSSSTFGTRVVQDDDGYFTDTGTIPGAGNWEPVDGHNIGWFVMNLNVTEMEPNPVGVDVSNSDGETVTITLERTDSSSSRVDITSSVNGGPQSTVTCASTNGRLLLDLRSGESFTGDGCRFDGTTEIQNASTVALSGGENAFGRYSLVANETGSVSGSGGPLADCTSSASDVPCRSPVVWSANVTVTVGNSNSAYENSHNVSVYEVNR